jgi:hypothetical protein
MEAVKVGVAPRQIDVGVMPVGALITLTVVVRRQPVGAVNVTIDVPTATAHTTPLEEPTVATEGVLPLHVPPGVDVLNVVQYPTQRLVLPVLLVIPPGNELTVTTAVI